MTHKTKNTTNTITEEAQVAAMPVAMLGQTEQDAKNALLMVSLIANAFVLIGWITLQVTTIYDAQVAAFLFIR